MTDRCQQFELYSAETQVDHGRHLGSLREIQTWVDDLRETWWWPKLYWMVERVEVGTSRKQHESVGWFEPDKNAGRIELGSRLHAELDVIHELAHVLANARTGSESHDPAFARIYGELTYLIRGPQAWLALQRAFESHGIDYGQRVEEAS